jgi:hypothetical protein
MVFFDFGGQTVFAPIFSYFLTPDVVYLVVFSMEELMSQDDQIREEAFAFLVKVLNNITIHSRKGPNDPVADIVLVGTRKDVISSPEDHQNISNELLKRFRLFPAWPSVVKYDNAVMGSKGRTTLTFFPVDNTKSSKDPVVQDLKRVVETLAIQSLSLKTKVPLAWIQCVDLLTADPRCCLTLEEVREVAAGCGISDKDNNIYNYLHMLRLCNQKGVLMWHEEESLRGVVILNPIEFLVTPLTILICKFLQSGSDPTMHERPIHKKAQRQFARKYADLTDYGRLAHSLLLVLLEEYQMHFDVLLGLMIKFGFLVEIQPKKGNHGVLNAPIETYYIVPALLPERKGTERLQFFDRETRFFFGLTIDPDVASAFSVAFAENLQQTCKITRKYHNNNNHNHLFKRLHPSRLLPSVAVQGDQVE